MNKNKKDIYAKIYMFLLNLKEVKNKTYSFDKCDKNSVYLFNNYDEFNDYFESNGIDNISEDILEACRMKTTKKGTIIALKGICDYAIRLNNLINSNNIDLEYTKESYNCEDKIIKKKKI